MSTLSPCDGAWFAENRNLQHSYANTVADLDLDLVLDLDLDRLFDRASLDNRRLVQIQVEDQVQVQFARYEVSGENQEGSSGADCIRKSYKKRDELHGLLIGFSQFVFQNLSQIVFGQGKPEL
jgi:hypothetical protein